MTIDNKALYKSGCERKNQKSDFWQVCHNKKIVYRR